MTSRPEGETRLTWSPDYRPHGLEPAKAALSIPRLNVVRFAYHFASERNSELFPASLFASNAFA